VVNRPIGYDSWVYYVNFQSSLIVICGGQVPPNFSLHRAARMLKPALGISLLIIIKFGLHFTKLYQLNIKHGNVQFFGLPCICNA